MPTAGKSLVVGISSRALFNLDEAHEIFEQQGVKAYSEYQMEREYEPLQPGVGFRLVQKLLNINRMLEQPSVEVVLVSRNSANTGLRIFHSIEHHGLSVTLASFSGGRDSYRYVRPFGVHLFLSAADEDVQGALQSGIPAAVLLPGNANTNTTPVADTGWTNEQGKQQDKQQDNKRDDEVRIAFDGDAVLFGAESEEIYQTQGKKAFIDNEKAHASEPMCPGPFLPFAQGLQSLQAQFDPDHCPVRTALVTARAAPAHERAIKTLRQWNIRLDEALFLGGADKGEFLAAFGADIFFDDKAENCAEASRHTATGHVPGPQIQPAASKRTRGQKTGGKG